MRIVTTSAKVQIAEKSRQVTTQKIVKLRLLTQRFSSSTGSMVVRSNNLWKASYNKVSQMRSAKMIVNATITWMLLLWRKARKKDSMQETKMELIRLLLSNYMAKSACSIRSRKRIIMVVVRSLMTMKVKMQQGEFEDSASKSSISTLTYTI